MASHSDRDKVEPAQCKPRVLVTGLNGFTGRYVSSALDRLGYECVGLIDMEGRSVDITDTAAVDAAVLRLRPTYVIHLAAVAFVAHADVTDFYVTNIVGSRNLLAALAKLEAAPLAVVLASSANVYGNSRDVPLREVSKVSPANDYAVSKLAMEHMASTWFDKLPITIVRPFNYTGVGQSPSFLVPKLVSNFLRRAQGVALGNLDVARDFSDVRVVADVYARLLSADVAGKTLNVCSSQPVSLQEIVEMLENITGHRIDITVDSRLVRANEIKTLYGSADELRNIVPDYAPIPLEQTLRWMIESR